MCGETAHRLFGSPSARPEGLGQGLVWSRGGGVATARRSVSPGSPAGPGPGWEGGKRYWCNAVNNR